MILGEFIFHFMLKLGRHPTLTDHVCLGASPSRLANREYLKMLSSQLSGGSESHLSDLTAFSQTGADGRRRHLLQVTDCGRINHLVIANTLLLISVAEAPWLEKINAGLRLTGVLFQHRH